MTNPAPRPALRKAPDADVHPAAGQPQATTTLKRATGQTSASNDRKTTQIDLRNRASAEVTDHPVVTSILTVNPGGSDTEGPEAVAKKSKKSNKGSSKAKSSSKKSSKKSDKKKKKSGKSKKKKGKGAQPGARTDMRISVATQVPTSVRRALRTSAKARGTSVEDRVDSVVTSLRES
ncbi:MAG: hypothetical protein WC054_05400 [Candidatus Nanopelagicales bacterium]